MSRWGLWTLAELDAAGVPRSTVRDRVRRGRLERVLPGVFTTEPLDHLGLCRATALWRPDAVVSHRSAAALWGLVDAPDTVSITVPRHVHPRAPSWVELHRRDLHPAAVTTGWGFRLVTPERALVDSLLVSSDAVAEELVDLTLGRTINPWTVQQLLVRDAGRWGAGVAGRHLRAWPGTVDSEPERLLGRALRRRRRLFDPGARVLGYRVDFLHRPSWTVVEVDGREFHVAPDVFVSDRRRQNEIQRSGLLVVRYAAVSVLADVEAVADEICSIVDERGPRHRAF